MVYDNTHYHLRGYSIFVLPSSDLNVSFLWCHIFSKICIWSVGLLWDFVSSFIFSYFFVWRYLSRLCSRALLFVLTNVIVN